MSLESFIDTAQLDEAGEGGGRALQFVAYPASASFARYEPIADGQQDDPYAAAVGAAVRASAMSFLGHGCVESDDDNDDPDANEGPALPAGGTPPHSHVSVLAASGMELALGGPGRRSLALVAWICDMLTGGFDTLFVATAPQLSPAGLSHVKVYLGSRVAARRLAAFSGRVVCDRTGIWIAHTQAGARMLAAAVRRTAAQQQVLPTTTSPTAMCFAPLSLDGARLERPSSIGPTAPDPWSGLSLPADEADVLIAGALSTAAGTAARGIVVPMSWAAMQAAHTVRSMAPPPAPQPPFVQDTNGAMKNRNCVDAPSQLLSLIANAAAYECGDEWCAACASRAINDALTWEARTRWW